MAAFSEHQEDTPAAHAAHSAESPGSRQAPSLLAVMPFVALLLSIALLPLIPKTAHWWHHNRNKLLVALLLAAATLGYYQWRGTGFHTDTGHTKAGLPTVTRVLEHAVVEEYFPFIVLLFSLYTICGGVQLKGDIQATPLTNTTFLATGSVLASLVGTTGASMLLIRPLLQTNQERKYVRHTVIFFIFLVSNIGGTLLPTGDPPLFLGYLRGVPFLWTLRLLTPWAVTVLVLLILYFLWDSRLYRREPPQARLLDKTLIEPLRVRGLLNFLWLAGVVISVALLVPGQPFLGRFFVVPEHVRELAQLLFVALAWITSAPRVRQENSFDFTAIVEVAALFIGIFITMQAPIEILKIKGPQLGLSQPAHFFWATGVLSGFLDNAPTYVVFFETAKSLPLAAGVSTVAQTGVMEPLLIAVALGSVFMGANTYIGNGPNFMVKTIAEQSGVKMPSFFGYMAYSAGILIPVFLALTAVFFLR